MYEKGTGVPQDYALAHMWFNLSGSNGYKDAVKNREIIEKVMCVKRNLRKLEKMLEKAIEEEDYEKASEIRDEINRRKDN